MSQPKRTRGKRIGRPPKAEADKHSRQMFVKLIPKDYELIIRAAAAAGVNISEFFRMCALKRAKRMGV